MRKVLLICSTLFLLFLFTGCKKNDKNIQPIDQPVYFVVSFNSDDGSQVSSQQVEKGTKIYKPNDPVKEGYDFDGWYNGNEKWNFNNNVVLKDLELVAAWKPIEFTLTIKYNDETAPDLVINKEYNSIIDSVDEPQREDYSFIGWSEKIPNRMPAENLTIYANWKISTYKLTIKYNDETTPDLVINKEYNSIIDSVDEPQREGYSFTGWSEEIPDRMPAENLTIYARWKISTYKLTIKYNDGVTPDLVIKKEYNSSIGTISNPQRKGYSFTGWNQQIPDKMPSKNITIVAS